MAVRIVTDSTADMDRATCESLGISVVPLTIEIDGTVYRDAVDLAPEDFYRRLVAAASPPKTAAPSPGAYTEAFEAALHGGDSVVCITISGRLSGSLNAARAGRDGSSNPERVRVIDSLAATAAEANIVTAAALTAAGGADVAQTVAAAEQARERQRLLVGLETLDYLQRGGRIGRARAFVGGLLSIKPLLTLQGGEVAPAERVRTRARMLARLEEFALSYADPQMVSIVHADCPDAAESLQARVSAAFPQAKVTSGWIGPVVGLYTGPGALGVAILPKDFP
jgi:DegV family protein with EDD domain